MIQRTSRKSESDTSASAEEIERETNWRPGDDSVLEDIRSGNAKYAILRLSLDRLSVQEAEILVAAWRRKAKAPDIHWMEISKDEFKKKLVLTTREKEGPVYVVRYRDVVFASQAWRWDAADEIEFVDANRKRRDLSEIDQIWLSEPNPVGNAAP